MDFPFPKSNIEKLHTYKPNFGKSKTNNLIRLSANESALGASLNAIKALKNFSIELNRYPPQVSDELISAISKRYTLNKKKIILGNGSDELISILAQTFLNFNDEAIYTEFGFLQFPQAISTAGAKGVIAMQISERNGQLIGAAQVTEDDELMLISDKGMLVRTRVSEVNIIGRNTQGVIVIRLKDSEKLISIAPISEEFIGDE